MEQAESRYLIRAERLLAGAAIIAFVSFGIYSALLILGQTGRFEIGGYMLLAVTVMLFLASLRSKSTGLVSLSWIVLGFVFIEYLIHSPQGNIISVSVSVVILLGSYELSRFSFLTRPVIGRVKSLNPESLARLQKVFQNHGFSQIEILGLALVSSLAIEFLTVGEVSIKPPIVGVAILASISVILIVVAIISRIERFQ